MKKRAWGHWEVLCEGDGYKVKKIVVNPRKSLSYQRHQHRDEHWVVIGGKAMVEVKDSLSDRGFHLGKNESIDIPKITWHQLGNDTKEPLEIIEVSTGDIINEEDIERK